MVDKKITVTRDVEVIEMTDLGIGTTWNVSTMAKEPTSWFAGFQRSERRREKTIRHGSIRPIMRNGHYDVHAANAKTATTPLARELKGRHLQMIAFGGSIGEVPIYDPISESKTDIKGTGLFVASGAGLYHAGPAGLLLAYIGVGALLYCTMQSLCELSVLFPVAGSFITFSTRFLDPSWGFALSWVYFLQWLMVLPLEIIAAVLTISYWNEVVPNAVFVTIFLVLIIAINMAGIRFYGETEFVFAIIKIVAIIGFILLGIVINIGGPPDGGFIGGKLWFQPQPFNNGFKGFSSALTTALFSYGGTEMIGLAVAETRDPRKSFPKAIKQVFWRIAIFYLITIMLVGLLVPSDNPSLIGGKSSVDASASAFVIAIESAGTTILPSVMNGVILIAVLSVGSSAVYGSSRALEAMAELSHAPQLFTYIDKRGRPLVSLFIAGCVGLLAYTIDVKLGNVRLDP
ncbi:hypothetical protein LB504_008504 [Fusarium proliferatum]|nr:hypothetical protein LB504_008504 [Fusarium proliferatum]